jgi:hypothetical protein
MKPLLMILLVHLVPVLAFGAIRRDAIICNASGVEIEVYYVSGELNERIESGESKQIVYPPASELLPISFASKLYRFPCRTPPTGFMKAGMFKNTFKMVIGDDRRLYLIPFETLPAEAWATAKTQSQPEGWPIEGIPTNANGGLKRGL